MGFGSNQFGQLASHLTSISRPTILDFVPNQKITQISCGMRHTCAITEAGEAFFWGENKYAQCGQSDLLNISIPKRLELNYFIDSASLGSRHSLVVTRCKKLFAFGEDKYGQTGVDPKSIESFTVKDQKGKQKTINHVVTKPREVALPQPHVNRIRVCSGWNHNLLLLTRAIESFDIVELYSFGRNNYGQLGIGTCSPYDWMMQPVKIESNSAILEICCGAEHNLVLNSDGEVWSFGWNEHGQLGLGHNRDEPTPSKINFPKSARIASIACGYGYSFASLLQIGNISC